MIEGVGPRYCPSIESKIVRFANKERHQLFIEPEGRSTNEMYVQGMSSSLPAHIQLQFMQTIPGLEHCKMMRAGYAIDYDCLIRCSCVRLWSIRLSAACSVPVSPTVPAATRRLLPKV